MANSRESMLRNRLVEQAMEGSATAVLMLEVCAPLWESAREHGDPTLLAECEDLAEDIAEVKRHTRRIAGMVERMGRTA